MLGSASGRWKARKTEKLKLAEGIVPKIAPQADASPRIYLSHTVVHTRELEEEFLKCSGVRYRCFSYVYLDPEAIYWSPRALEAYEVDVEHCNHIMMDSGAFSFQQFLVKRKDVTDIDKLRLDTVDKYVHFCKKRKKDWDFYVTFDYAPKAEIVWKMTKVLREKGLNPVPIYHGDASIDWLKKYLDLGYKRIGMSPGVGKRMTYKGARRCLDEVFRAIEGYHVKMHGFGLTSIALTYAYPWYSVDSSSWSRTASYGAIISMDPDRGSLGTIHVSLTGGLKQSTSKNSITTLAPEALKSVQSYVEKLGWDFDLLRRSLAYRFIFNGWIFSHMNDWYKPRMEKSTHVSWGSAL